MEKIKSMLENAAVSGIDVWNPMEYQMECIGHNEK